MRKTASILHLDMDAFFASVEQRDKPSLQSRPVIVGGVGTRGVVSTASYEARKFGVHSAQSMAEAHRRCPNGAFLAGRFDAYHQSSKIVMALLRQLSALVEPLSIDEAFVDLAAGGYNCADLNKVTEIVEKLRDDVTRLTAGLTCSIGVGSSKFIAKLGSEMAKPAGVKIIPPGTEVDLIADLPVRSLPGVGQATSAKLSKLGVDKVQDLRALTKLELVQELGQAAGESLQLLAWAKDDRSVTAQREAKSISVEDTFETDVDDLAELNRLIDRYGAIVADKLANQNLFAKTVTLKVRFADFTTITRSRTLLGSTDSPSRIAVVGRQLLSGIQLFEGVRLLGLGVSNFTIAAQEELFYAALSDGPGLEEITTFSNPPLRRVSDSWLPGMEVIHEDLGRGWVWGSGLGVVTVRFEYRGTSVGRVRSFAQNDPLLAKAKLLELPGDKIVAAENDSA